MRLFRAWASGSLVVALLAAATGTTGQSTRGAPRAAATSWRDPLLAGFASPGAEARPRVWWHWMNGNVTREGIRLDMEWMKRVGIAGLQSFDAGHATARVVAERLPYMTPEWRRAFRATAVDADELGLELGIAASPGWSETGGPWVAGGDAMKKMAWSVTHVKGGIRFASTLPRPPDATGIFQTSTAGWTLGGRAPGQNPPRLYVDQKVVAFRIPAGAALPTPVVTASGGRIDAAALADGDIQTPALSLPAGATTGALSWVRFDYGHPVTVRGLTLATDFASRYYDGLSPRRPGFAPTGFRLEASDDGDRWRDTGANVVPGLPERTISVDAVRARFFRLVSVRQPPETPLVRLPRFARPTPPPPDAITINELVLRGEATIHSFEDKAAFVTNGDYYALPTGTKGSAAARSGDVVDLTGRMGQDGTLDWTAPPGEWDVLRIGYSLTGAMNRPASPEATGLEVDKLDAAAVRRYMDHYLGLYRDATGGLMGPRGLRAMMFDSWEASNENWTPLILADFRRLRGYDPTPWLPTLAGYVVDSAQRSDAFLWDWRRTLQQLLKQNHYDQLTAMLHGIGMIRYGEAHEALYATMGDGMEMKQSADVPMGAMWQVDRPGEIEPVYFNDIQESASVAHIYGQNLVATEALTGGPPFGSSPWSLKPTADAILLAGANRFVIHTSAHQPVSRGPGLTLGVGQYFTRNETWAEQAGPWMDYLARASFLLQQGRSASDVAVFYGEAGPVITTYRTGYPPVPEGYRYDYVNADALLTRLHVADGAAVADGGARYSAILMGAGARLVSLPVLERLRALVQDGATLIGKRPAGSPSLADDPAAVRAVLDTLWPGSEVATVGKGRVFAAAEAGPVLTAIGLAPDVSFGASAGKNDVMFIHRRLLDGEVYFVSNRFDRVARVRASFRVAGLAPQLWDPATGLARPASYRLVGGRTEVDLSLDRFGSVFVVFRGGGAPAGRTIADDRWSSLATLTEPWTVAFEPGRGAPTTARFARLADFRDNPDPGVRYFSGIASYPAEFDIARTDLTNGKRVWIDLGDVHDLAEIEVNGLPAGVAWKPPYRVDVTDQVRPGRNRVDIRTVNLWVNRLIGDVQPGVTRKITFTAADGVPSPGATAAEVAAERRMPYAPSAPLVPSGLIGPVTVLSQTPGESGLVIGLGDPLPLRRRRHGMPSARTSFRSRNTDVTLSGN